MTEQTYEGHEIPIYSVKGSQKLKDIQARLVFKHQLHLEWWKICVIMLCF